jgi:hypothetical protein
MLYSCKKESQVEANWKIHKFSVTKRRQAVMDDRGFDRLEG